MFSLAIGTGGGVSVEPSEVEMSVTEVQTVTLSCTFSADSTNILIFWYRQYPSEPPLYTRRHDSEGDVFIAEFATVIVTDAATYYCGLSRGAQCYNSTTSLYKNPTNVEPCSSVVTALAS
uniref:Ig-like domain-containing protein n=1 Tax=Callorhinchus milii TaxID=7868 RepID=A0A4W3JJG3_CALMI